MTIHGTGRHLDPLELQLWTGLVDAGRILDTELERQLVTEHDMTHREYEVLVRVDGSGGRKRMRALSREIEASGPLVSQTVARLERRGWIERVPAADDGRGVDAVLLPAGVDALAAAAAPHARLIRSLLHDQLPEGTLDAAAAALHAVATHLRHHRSGEDCDHPDCPLSG